jgi:hypothetical protein
MQLTPKANASKRIQKTREKYEVANKMCNTTQEKIKPANHQ